jgi:hypothetical protein
MRAEGEYAGDDADDYCDEQQQRGADGEIALWASLPVQGVHHLEALEGSVVKSPAETC